MRQPIVSDVLGARKTGCFDKVFLALAPKVGSFPVCKYSAVCCDLLNFSNQIVERHLAEYNLCRVEDLK